jgi:predicted site-specific integrase-resolvase
MSREELLALPAVVNLVTAARALGIGRTRAFELTRRGEFPVPVLRVGRTYRVPTAPLLKLLGLAADGGPELDQAS